MMLPEMISVANNKKNKYCPFHSNIHYIIQFFIAVFALIERLGAVCRLSLL